MPKPAVVGSTRLLRVQDVQVYMAMPVLSVGCLICIKHSQNNLSCTLLAGISTASHACRKRCRETSHRNLVAHKDDARV